MNACDDRLRGNRKHARTARHQLRRSSDRLCPFPYSTNNWHSHGVASIRSRTKRGLSNSPPHHTAVFRTPLLNTRAANPCDAHAQTRPSNHNLFLRVQIIIASLWLLRWWDQNGMSGVKRVLARMYMTIAASPSRRKGTHTCAKITCGAPFRWLVWVRVAWSLFLLSILFSSFFATRILKIQIGCYSCSRARDMILCTTLGNALVLSCACV